MDKLAAKNLVFIKEGQPITTSLKVGEAFGKSHKETFKAIRKRALVYSKEFRNHNFTPARVVDECGDIHNIYELTRDGFSLLGFGPQGKDEAKTYISFLEAFDQYQDRIWKLQSHGIYANKKQPKSSLYRSKTNSSGNTTLELVAGLQSVDARQNLSQMQAKRAGMIMDCLEAYLRDLTDDDKEDQQRLTKIIGFLKEQLIMNGSTKATN